MSNKKEQKELLEKLFEASRGDLQDEWSDDAYVLADLINIVDKTPEETARDYATAEVIDMLFNVYKVDKRVGIHYAMNTNEFMDNVMDRIDEAMVREVEEFVSSSDILKYQK